MSSKSGNESSQPICLFVCLFLIMFYIFSLLRISNSNGGEYICESEGLASKQFMNRGFLQTRNTVGQIGCKLMSQIPDSFLIQIRIVINRTLSCNDQLLDLDWYVRNLSSQLNSSRHLKKLVKLSRWLLYPQGTVTETASLDKVEILCWECKYCVDSLWAN